MRPIFFAALCLLTGCLARPHLERQTFIFAPSPPSEAKAAPGSRVLGIRNLQVAAPFAGRAFVYRTDESAYDSDPYAEFMVAPAEGLAASIRDWLRNADVFTAVVEAGSAHKPDTLVEIQVSQLYGDFRHPENPSAVLAMHLVFFDAANGVPGKVILQRDYAREIPLKARTAVALISGWNQALAQVLDSAMLDFRQSDMNPAKP